MTYDIVFTRGYKLPREGDFVRLAHGFPTVADAASHRKWSGDLIVDAQTLRIAQSDVWLFPWEREEANCYARQMQDADQRTLTYEVPRD